MIGERWLRPSTSVVLSMPSAVMPNERNFVLNPAHPDFGELTIHSSEPFSFDPRMWKTSGERLPVSSRAKFLVKLHDGLLQQIHVNQSVSAIGRRHAL